MAIKHTVKTVKLTNGVEGLFIDALDASVAAYSIQFRGGEGIELMTYPFQIGHTLEHLVERGPKGSEYPQKADYLRELQKNGAWRNAYTNESGISYVGDCTPDELIRILRLRVSAIESPKITEKDLKGEKGNVLEEIKQRVVDYARLSTALARKEINNGTWLTSLEAIEHAKSVTLSNVQKFYATTHTLANLRFVVAGNIGHLEDSITELFNLVDLPAGSRLYGSNMVPAVTNGYSYELRPRLENLFTSFAMAISRALTPQEVAAMEVASHLLCNSWDSEILGKAREAGLCYSMRGYTESFKTQSIWAFDTPIGPDNATDFFALMSAALKKLTTENIDEQAIRRAKDFLVGSAKKNGQTSLELLDLYTEDYFALDRVTNFHDKTQYLEDVSAEDISRLASEFVNATSQVFSGVGSISVEDFSSLYDNFRADLDN